MNNKGWIGVDLDGTLAHYEKFVSHDQIGAPIPEMVNRVKHWLLQGWTVKIFTARVTMDGSIQRAMEVRQFQKALKDWCALHIGRELEVTNQKDCNMLELWDDRARQVLPNTGKALQDLYVKTMGDLQEALDLLAEARAMLREVEEQLDTKEAPDRVYEALAHQEDDGA